MNKYIRLAIVLVATLIFVVLASNSVAWASLSPRPMDPTIVPQVVQLEWDKGSVRPPNCEGLTITKSGQYSVCGMAIVGVEFKTNEDVKLLASFDPAIPERAGDVAAGSVVIGCLVNGVSDIGPHNRHADIKICFAALPENESVVKFYDEVTSTWKSLETTVTDGQACTIADYSGKYVLVKE